MPNPFGEWVKRSGLIYWSDGRVRYYAHAAWRGAVEHFVEQMLDSLRSRFADNATMSRGVVEKFLQEEGVMAIGPPYSDAPCGHSEQYCYTKDGGATIICLMCEKESLECQLEHVRRQSKKAA